MSKELAGYWESLTIREQTMVVTNSPFWGRILEKIGESLSGKEVPSYLMGEMMVGGVKNELWRQIEEEEELDPLDNEKAFDDRDRARDLKDALKVIY